MGQYYMITNMDKKEYLYPHKLGSGLKLWEIAASNLPRALVLLLQDSNGRGGGDGEIDDPEINPFVGRWAHNKIAIVGDYDDKNIYGQLKDSTTWTDISDGMRSAFDKWIEVEEYKLSDPW